MWFEKGKKLFKYHDAMLCLAKKDHAPSLAGWSGALALPLSMASCVAWVCSCAYVWMIFTTYFSPPVIFC